MTTINTHIARLQELFAELEAAQLAGLNTDPILDQLHDEAHNLSLAIEPVTRHLSRLLFRTDFDSAPSVPLSRLTRKATSFSYSKLLTLARRGTISAFKQTGRWYADSRTFTQLLDMSIAADEARRARRPC